MNDVRGLLGVHLRSVARLLQERGVLSSGQALVARLMSGGRSNLTYRLDAGDADGDGPWVLRRPPLGGVLSTAHDMSREYRVLDALSGGDASIPVPRPVLICNDAEVIGAPFYVMEYVSGDVLRTSHEALSVPAHDQTSVSADLIDVMAELHTVNPESVGLQDFGRPEGFTGRQVVRWTRQLEASRSREVADIQRLAEALGRTVPPQRYSAIIHGDHKLDNCVTRHGAVAAVLDWEMSTLGDPLADLALFCVYYAGFTDLQNPILLSLAGLGSYLPLADLLERYVDHTGYDLTNLEWYLAFAWFKLAAILEGIHYRSTLGATEGDGFEGVADLVEPAVQRGMDKLARLGIA